MDTAITESRAMTLSEQKTLDDIAKYGCHVIYVLPEAELPPFAYSVGIQQSFRAPELVVIGLKQPISHAIVNNYTSRIKDGERFHSGQRVSGFVAGFECEFRSVDRSHYREYFGWDIWLYAGHDFDVLQLVCPDTAGNWPWATEASEWFRNWQPILDRPIAATSAADIPVTARTEI